jgi:hypothetical protein
MSLRLAALAGLEKINAEVELQVESALARIVRPGPEVVKSPLNVPPG